MTEPRFAYPVALELGGRDCLVVGGGGVALRKAQALAAAGARVRVVAPRHEAALAEDGRFTLIKAAYAPEYVAGAHLVVAATDDKAVNRRVAADARAARVWVNVVDRPELCDFIVPARLQRGHLTVAISTGGAAPRLSARLRRELEPRFGEEYAVYTEVMGALRTRIKAAGLGRTTRKQVFERLAEDDLLEAARQGREALSEAAEAAVREILGLDWEGGGAAP